MKPEQNVKHQEVLCCHSLWFKTRRLDFSYRRRLLMHAPFGELHGGSRHHAVAARRFSGVKGLVSGGEEVFGCAAGCSFEVSYTNRYGERRAFWTVLELCHTRVDAGSQAHLPGRQRLWQERHKLIPSIACSNIGHAQRARQGRCHTANCLVACIVAGAIVDGFEPIDVNDEERKRSLIAFGAGNFL